jgi:gamma-glutamyl:cysteine ligase YbdK (ATP-grasp superfamily)
MKNAVGSCDGTHRDYIPVLRKLQQKKDPRSEIHLDYTVRPVSTLPLPHQKKRKQKKNFDEYTPRTETARLQGTGIYVY